MRKAEEVKGNVHLRVDDIILSLLSDYHGISPVEAIDYFRTLAKQMTEVDGNIVNKNRASVRTRKTKYFKNGWRTVTKQKYDKAANYTSVANPFGNQRSFEDAIASYDAYSLRGFYPGSKVPFKMSGVKQKDASISCFVIKMGNKDKQTKFNVNKLSELDQIMADAVLLDEKPHNIAPDYYKVKSFRCQRPKGLPLLKKAKDEEKE